MLVNCVTPAAAKTAIFDQMTQQHIDYMLSKIPMNRFVTVDEIAALGAGSRARTAPSRPAGFSTSPEGEQLIKKTKPRSVQWFGRQDIYGFIYRSWVKNRGVPQDQFDGRPVIGICNTWSELTPCNTHFRVLAEHVRHGILEAGGFPLEFPVMSLGETLLRPTAMLYRNLAAWTSRNRSAATRSTAWCCSPAATRPRPRR